MKAYAIYDCNDKPLVYTIEDIDETYPWYLLVRDSMGSTDSYEDVVNSYKKKGYTCKEVQIVDKDSVVIDREVYELVRVALLCRPPRKSVFEQSVIDAAESFVLKAGDT